eukprot:12411728-Karenia_brevis.AAC.1
MAFQELQEHMKLREYYVNSIKMAFQELQEDMKLCEYHVNSQSKWFSKSSRNISHYATTM